MGIDFTVFKGSASGDIIEAKGHRETGETEALIELSHCGVCGTDEHYRKPIRASVMRVLESSKSLAWSIPHLRSEGWGPSRRGVDAEVVSEMRTMHDSNSVQFGNGNLDEGCFGTAVAWDVSTIIKVPDEIASEHAGPLACGRATVFEPLYQNDLKPGDRIGVIGIGGLGHLAIQFASKMGMEVVVFSGTDSKRNEAIKFGAAEFVATKGEKQFEGVEPIDHQLITTSFLPDFSLYMPILKPYAKIFPLTISMDAAPIPVVQLISKAISIVGSGGAHPHSMKVMMESVRNTVFAHRSRSFQ